MHTGKGNLAMTIIYDLPDLWDARARATVELAP